MTLGTLVGVLRNPVPADTRRALSTAWARVPDHLRTPRQFLGRQYAGCGATIGAMPRCDFACRGCYLGPEANSIPPAPFAEVTRQLDRLRAWLGEGGNVQLTDGELTLRPEPELVAMIRHARAIGLVPMLMTHGDAFRRRPGLLERLMTDGGLTELSLHVDTTQRGRRGYRDARSEADLTSLRDELAELVRRARRSTGRRLEVATTVTVSRENLAGVPAIIRWLLANADAFKMVSFQPVAAVGRTDPALAGGVTPDELWGRIAQGLTGRAGAVPDRGHEGWLGHPGCSRFVQGAVVRQPGQRPAFHPLFRPDDPLDRALIEEWLARFGGLTFRLDSPGQALARLAGVFAAAPGFLIRRVIPFLLRWPGRLDPDHRARFVLRWIRGQARVDYLNIVSHHFMSRAELETPIGRERLAVCVFHVPIGSEMVSMCEVNALGGRDRYYAQLRAAEGRPTGRPGEPRISVVIPALDEAANLERLLPDLVGRWPTAEVVVVDGGSRDATAQVVRHHPTVRYVSAARGRARQMNAGAAATAGDVLVFLHADTRLPDGALEALGAALADPPVVGGRFDVRFDTPRRVMRVVAWFMNARSRLSGIATGDQTLFVRREVFAAIGGFPEIPLMEDVELSKQLKRRGRLACLRLRVTTSARKWEREGAWRTIALMWTLRFLYVLGVEPARLHRWYYGRDPAP